MRSPVPPPVAGRDPSAIAGLVRRGILDAELAGLLSLTLEARVPAVVTGGPADVRREVRDALLGQVPATVGTVVLAGPAESFDWMPERSALGWTSPGAAPSPHGGTPPAPATAPAVMVAAIEEGATGTWGDAARLAIRALTAGYGLIATAAGTSLDDLLGRLAAAPVGAIDDELTRLGVVLVLGDDRDGPVRVQAAHYLRPVARDAGGHVQRRPPAVLATWNAAAGRFDHFAWGIVDELAGRTGRRALDFEREQGRRAAAISAGIAR